MQDIPDIAGAHYEDDFTWLYTLETGYYSCTVRACNKGLQQWRKWRGCKGVNLFLGKLNVKTGHPFSLYFGIQYFFGFQ